MKPDHSAFPAPAMAAGGMGLAMAFMLAAVPGHVRPAGLGCRCQARPPAAGSAAGNAPVRVLRVRRPASADPFSARAGAGCRFRLQPASGSDAPQEPLEPIRWTASTWSEPLAPALKWWHC